MFGKLEKAVYDWDSLLTLMAITYQIGITIGKTGPGAVTALVEDIDAVVLYAMVQLTNYDPALMAAIKCLMGNIVVSCGDEGIGSRPDKPIPASLPPGGGPFI